VEAVRCLAALVSQARLAAPAAAALWWASASLLLAGDSALFEVGAVLLRRAAAAMNGVPPHPICLRSSLTRVAVSADAAPAALHAARTSSEALNASVSALESVCGVSFTADFGAAMSAAVFPVRSLCALSAQVLTWVG
jgi:hypothetical protein